MTRLQRLALTVFGSIAIVFGCGSPDQYQRQYTVADTGSVAGAVGFKFATEEDSRWAEAWAASLQASRISYDAGNRARGFQIADSLIDAAETEVERYHHDDVRRKFLILMLTDLYVQSIGWEQVDKNPAGVEARTARFQALSEQLRRHKDSVTFAP